MKIKFYYRFELNRKRTGLSNASYYKGNKFIIKIQNKPANSLQGNQVDVPTGCT